MSAPRQLTRIGTALALAFACTLPARAALFEDDGARRAIIDLRGRYDASQRETQLQLDRLNLAIRESRELSARDAAAATERVDAAIRAQLELASMIESLKQELARLRGQIELLTNEVSNTQKRQRDFYTDIDARLRKIEPQQVTVDGNAALVDQSETRMYEAAMAQFRSSNFKGAITSFTNFLKLHPNSVYSPSAAYWIGTSHYAQRDYIAAISAQQNVINTWPTHPRAAEAMLNIASSQLDLGDRFAARRTLESLISTYGATPTANIARERLAALR